MGVHLPGFLDASLRAIIMTWHQAPWACGTWRGPAVTRPRERGCNKLRRAMVRPGRDRLTGTVEVDETLLA
jgi:hypothetical protein